MTGAKSSIIDGIIADLDSVRYGANKAWIFKDEKSEGEKYVGVSDDVFVFDTIKLLEAIKEDDEIEVITNELPVDIEAVRKEAEEAQEMLKSLRTVGDVINFINGKNGGLIDLDSIVVEKDGEFVDLDYAGDIDELPKDTKIVKVGFDEFGDYVYRPTFALSAVNGALFKDDTFEFGICDTDTCDVIVEECSLEDFEQTLKELYTLDPEQFWEMSDVQDNTYNFSANLSNDFSWCEADTEEYGRVAMLRFHRAGDVRGNYTDELFIKLGECKSLTEYLYMRDEYTNLLTNHAEVEVDGKEYEIDINALRNGIEVYDTENWDNICTCYDYEKDDVTKAIEENVREDIDRE